MGKNKLEKLVEVIWLDAVSGKIDINDRNNLIPLDYLAERRSYGRIYKKDENAIILINTEDRLTMEYIAIPNVWIKQINYYKRE